ncbi:unnamed protein product [Pleuronectes platessa]|uniref:Uncharacterized protein n=1 Tax=Pleuronectes platessa TaxID=8262 RepID=A0A9N7YL38_PLEPL|nr:unnamed protein product [Pleuronectes platessa]
MGCETEMEEGTGGREERKEEEKKKGNKDTERFFKVHRRSIKPAATFREIPLFLPTQVPEPACPMHSSVHYLPPPFLEFSPPLLLSGLPYPEGSKGAAFKYRPLAGSMGQKAQRSRGLEWAPLPGSRALWLVAAGPLSLPPLLPCISTPQAGNRRGEEVKRQERTERWSGDSPGMMMVPAESLMGDPIPPLLLQQSH